MAECISYVDIPLAYFFCSCFPTLDPDYSPHSTPMISRQIYIAIMSLCLAIFMTVLIVSFMASEALFPLICLQPSPMFRSRRISFLSFCMGGCFLFSSLAVEMEKLFSLIWTNIYNR